jgi:hypothetical protein
MSEAVKFAWDILRKMKLENIDDFDNYDYHESLCRFVYALQIKQGDYRIVDVKKEGLMIEYSNRRPVNLTDNQTKAMIKMCRDMDYAKTMTECLRGALGRDYDVRIKNTAEDTLKKIEHGEGEFKTPEERNAWIESLETLMLFPEFEVYLHEEKLGTLFDIWFTFNPENPQAVHAMEAIGSRVFECKKGKVEFANYSGVEKLEEWRKELLKWKK